MKDQPAPMPAVLEASLDELELAAGGASQPFFSTVSPGLAPSHNYGVASDTFGQNLSFQQANDLVQRFNAPTADALYGQGNSPDATSGTVSRPGAGDLAGTPFDHGGNVTLQHGDGYAINQTVDFQHPLQGTISRNLVVDLNDGGGYQVLTLGRGENGAQLATIAGAVIAGPAGALAAQNGSHLVNPELGRQAFSQLDAAMIANANGQSSPNLQQPQGRMAEAAGLFGAVVEGAKAAFGYGPQAPADASAQTKLVYDVAKELNQQGPVEGYFMKSSVTDGVYHQTPEGTKYYERGPDGRPMLKEVDEFAGVDQAIAKQAALEAARQEAGTTMPDAPSDNPTTNPLGGEGLNNSLDTKAPLGENDLVGPAADAAGANGLGTDAPSTGDDNGLVGPAVDGAGPVVDNGAIDNGLVGPAADAALGPVADNGDLGLVGYTADAALGPVADNGDHGLVGPSTDAALGPVDNGFTPSDVGSTNTVVDAGYTYDPGAYQPMTTYDGGYDSAYGVGSTLSTPTYEAPSYDSSAYTYQSPLDSYSGLDSSYSPASSTMSYDSYNTNAFSGTSFDTSSSSFDSGSYGGGSFDTSSSYGGGSDGGGGGGFSGGGGE